MIGYNSPKFSHLAIYHICSVNKKKRQNLQKDKKCNFLLQTKKSAIIYRNQQTLKCGLKIHCLQTCNC